MSFHYELVPHNEAHSSTSVRGVVVVHEQEDEQAGGKNVANFRPATAERRAVSVSKREQQTTPMKRRLGQRKG